MLVGDLHPIGDDDMVVELRVSLPGFPMPEAGSEQPVGGVERDTLGAGAGSDDLILKPRNGLVNGCFMRSLKPNSLLLVGDSPRHRQRLRR